MKNASLYTPYNNRYMGRAILIVGGIHEDRLVWLSQSCATICGHGCPSDVSCRLVAFLSCHFVFNYADYVWKG